MPGFSRGGAGVIGGPRADFVEASPRQWWCATLAPRFSDSVRPEGAATGCWPNSRQPRACLLVDDLRAPPWARCREILLRNNPIGTFVFIHQDMKAQACDERVLEDEVDREQAAKSPEHLLDAVRHGRRANDAVCRFRQGKRERSSPNNCAISFDSHAEMLAHPLRSISGPTPVGRIPEI